jgi:hypothetical protein
VLQRFLFGFWLLKKTNKKTLNLGNQSPSHEEVKNDRDGAIILERAVAN